MTNSVHGKTELSLRRKKTTVDASQSPTISSDIKFAHQLSAGDTTIPLDALVLPVQMPSFVNPSAEKIAQANVKANASNLILVSSLRGTLVCDLSYKVISNTQINLEFEAEENEIIIGHFRATRATDQLLEGRLWSVTGTLSAGNTDFGLGQAFNTNANPNYQVGEVIVFVDGVQQYRNVGNATAAPAADGNYEEVDAGGVFNLIRFNQSFLSDVAVTVIPASYIVTTSDLALQPQIDALAGQIDAMIPILSAASGQPTSAMQGAPNNTDLKSFGDKVTQNTADIAQNASDIATKQDAFEIKWQIKYLNSTIGSNTVDIPDLRFNNLVPGKTYRVSGQIGMFADDIDAARAVAEIIHDGGIITRAQTDFPINSAGNVQNYWGVSAVFKATSTTLTVDFAELGGSESMQGDGTRGSTYLVLEELPNHTETSDFT